jgi:hypothetical protein
LVELDADVVDVVLALVVLVLRVLALVEVELEETAALKVELRAPTLMFE